MTVVPKKVQLRGLAPGSSFVSLVRQVEHFLPGSLSAPGDVELDRLAFLQAAKTACLDGRKMPENIVARLTADRAEAFGVVKPLQSSTNVSMSCLNDGPCCIR
jgi:hypothetical protein